MPPPKGWGLEPEGDPRFHWSARAILRDGVLDLLWDRAGVEGEASPNERESMAAWLNSKALPLLRANLPDPSDSGTYAIEGDLYRLRYSARRSFGYLYMSATIAYDATQPTPLPPVREAPKGKRRARSAAGRAFR